MNGTHAVADPTYAGSSRTYRADAFDPGQDPQSAPRDFEQAVVPLLRSARRRMTPEEIVSNLSQRGFPYSTHTVRTYLSRLVSKGILSSSRKKPFGYSLAEARPSAPSVVTEQDILETLHDVGFRMTRRALQAALYQRGLEWEEVQLSHDLTRLLDGGRITYKVSALPPGYGLPEWGDQPRTLGDE